MSHRILEQDHFCENDVAFFLRQILRAVFYLHCRGLVHRDRKPENFLLDQKAPLADMLLKIIDFGLSARWVQEDPDLMTPSGTPFYVAPEVLAKRYNSAADMWSCGAIAYILFCGCAPFNGDTDKEIIRSVKEGKVRFEECEWE